MQRTKVCAINYIHRNGVVHRDIKPANILIKSDGHLCLADFGLCKDWMSQDLYGEDEECPDHLHGHDYSTDKETQMTDAFVGTIPYMSPEAISREPYSYETDWWSLGVTFYEMLTGDVSSLLVMHIVSLTRCLQIPWCANTFEDTVLLIREAPLPYETEADVDATTKDFLNKVCAFEVTCYSPTDLCACQLLRKEPSKRLKFPGIVSHGLFDDM
jgi:serine/threonine protein kinase